MPSYWGARSAEDSLIKREVKFFKAGMTISEKAGFLFSGRIFRALFSTGQTELETALRPPAPLVPEAAD